MENLASRSIIQYKGLGAQSIMKNTINKTKVNIMCKLHPIELSMLEYLDQYYEGLLELELDVVENDAEDEDYVDHLEFMLMVVRNFKQGRWKRNDYDQEWNMLFQVYQEQLVEDWKFLKGNTHTDFSV